MNACQQKKEKKIVNTQINREQKKKWEEFTQNHPEVQSVSGLIRMSVERFMAREKGDSKSENIEEIEARLDQLQSDIDWLRNKQEESLESLARDLYNVLVPLPNDDPEERDHKAIHTVAFDDNPQTSLALAEQLGTSPKQVNNAIEYLRSHNFPIEQYEMEDNLHFFKLEE